MLPRLDENPPDPRTVIPTNPDPIPPPKHPIRLFLIYLSIGLLFFGIFCALTLWYIAQNYKPSSSLPVPKAIAQFIPKFSAFSSTSSNTPKLSWYSYTNPQYHFSFSYPPDWTAEQDTDNTVILYPPGSRSYASLTISDIGGGIGPKILVTIITREFLPPTSPQTFTTNSHMNGYSYVANQNTPDMPTIDFPLDNNKAILEFSAHNIGQENIDHFLKLHKSTLKVQDVDSTTYTRIVKTLHF